MKPTALEAFLVVEKIPATIVGRVAQTLHRGLPVHSPFPGWIPKALKRESGRADVVPAHIRVLGANLNRDARRYIRQKLSRTLAKFAQSIERVTVRVKDVNGPRGGVDQVCRIKVVLSNLPSVMVEARNAFIDHAFRRALAGAERAVRRTVQRRRMKPRKLGLRSRTRAA